MLTADQIEQHVAATDQETDPITLLITMACRDENSMAAERAFASFFEMFHPYLLAWSISEGYEAAGIDCDQLVVETMLTAYEKADRFTGKSSDVETSRKEVFAWLFTILKRKFIDEVRRISKFRKRLSSLSQADAQEKAEKTEDTRTTSQDAELAPPPRPAVLAARECLEELAPKEQALLFLSLEHFDAEQQKFIIPEEDLHDLADAFGVAPASIKTQRHRLLKKVMSKLEPQIDLKP